MNEVEAMFFDSMNQLYNVSDGSFKQFLSKALVVDYKKGAVIIEKGECNQYVFLVLEGFTRSYVIRDGKEHTAWFSKPGDPAVFIMGDLSAEQSRIYMEALCDCKLLRIARADLEELFRTNLELCNWGRRMADSFLNEIETIFTRDLVSNATERYENLITESPELVRQIPLKHLASYLLVAPESLSRIRKNIGKRTR